MYVFLIVYLCIGHPFSVQLCKLNSTWFGPQGSIFFKFRYSVNRDAVFTHFTCSVLQDLRFIVCLHSVMWLLFQAVHSFMTVLQWLPRLFFNLILCCISGIEFRFQSWRNGIVMLFFWFLSAWNKLLVSIWRAVLYHCVSLSCLSAFCPRWDVPLVSTACAVCHLLQTQR